MTKFTFATKKLRSYILLEIIKAHDNWIWM